MKGSEIRGGDKGDGRGERREERRGEAKRRDDVEEEKELKVFPVLISISTAHQIIFSLY